MSIPAESVARLITDAVGIVRDLGQKQNTYLSKSEMLSVYAFIEDMKKKVRDAEEATRLVGLSPELIETLKRLNMIGKAV